MGGSGDVRRENERERSAKGERRKRKGRKGEGVEKCVMENGNPGDLM